MHEPEQDPAECNVCHWLPPYNGVYKHDASVVKITYITYYLYLAFVRFFKHAIQKLAYISQREFYHMSKNTIKTL